MKGKNEIPNFKFALLYRITIYLCVYCTVVCHKFDCTSENVLVKYYNNVSVHAAIIGCFRVQFRGGGGKPECVFVSAAWIQYSAMVRELSAVSC